MSGSPSPFSSRRHGRRLAAVYGAASVALWPVPLLGLLHAESSAVFAAVACLAGAVGGAGAFRAGGRWAAVARVHLGALVVPLALLTATLLWRPNCGYLQGLGLFLLLVPPSALFGLGVAYAVTGLRLRAPRSTGAVAVLAVGLAGVAIDLGVHPQLFTYSHVFGGVLGPIYDAELAVRPGLFAAKGQTLLWALALAAVGGWGRGAGWRPVRLGLASGAALALTYAFAQPLGIVQTEGGIRRVLSATVDLGPVVLHLDPATPEAERRRLADEALFRFETLSERLGVAPEAPVAIYLYPDPATKAALVGSRETSVVPVWLPTPQVHMLADEAARSLGHELVHVLAREFGMPLLKASPAVGLVEGLAVALEPPDGRPDAAALVRAGDDTLGDPAEAVRATVSPGGFWTARAGVAYTANGAFVAWLLDTYGPAPFREAYRTGRFGPAYGRSLDALTAAWAADLAARPVDPEAVAVAAWLFAQPSLFEVRCPHHVPASIRAVRAGDEAWDEGRAEAAAVAYRAAVADDPLALGALAGRLRATLALGGEATPDDLRLARALADTLPTAATLVHLADVQRLTGADAAPTYRAAADSLAPVDALGRLLVGRRAALDRATLRTLLATPPDAVPDALRRRAPVLAALRLAAADRPAEAWALARTWCPDALLAGPDADGAGRRTLRLLQARLADRAGATSTRDALLDGLAEAFEADGPRSYAPVVRDLAARAEWRRGRAAGPVIFGDPPPVPDALAPCSAAGRPSRRRLRAPGGEPERPAPGP